MPLRWLCHTTQRVMPVTSVALWLVHRWWLLIGRNSWCFGSGEAVLVYRISVFRTAQELFYWRNTMVSVIDTVDVASTTGKHQASGTGDWIWFIRNLFHFSWTSIVPSFTILFLHYLLKEIEQNETSSWVVSVRTLASHGTLYSSTTVGSTVVRST